MTPTNETYELEGRTYARPEVPVTETDEFIANLRAVQDANNTDIKTQTENLGTDIASVQGGLIGPESYFTSRYQTPQTNQVVAELRSAAQASALNTALSNLQSQYQKRYQDAYKNYQKRASSGSGGGSGSGSGGGDTTSGDVTEKSTGDGGIKVSPESSTITTVPRKGLSGTSYVQDGKWITVYNDGSKYVNGVMVTPPQDKSDGASGSGGASGNGGYSNPDINRNGAYVIIGGNPLDNEGGGGW